MGGALGDPAPEIRGEVVEINSPRAGASAPDSGLGEGRPGIGACISPGEESLSPGLRELARRPSAEAAAPYWAGEGAGLALLLVRAEGAPPFASCASSRRTGTAKLQIRSPAGSDTR